MLSGTFDHKLFAQRVVNKAAASQGVSYVYAH